MKIAILDDYQDAVRGLDCFSLLSGHDVTVFTETMDEPRLADTLMDFDAVVLIRERTSISRTLIQRLPKLKLISQTGKVSGHVDVHAATEAGIAIAEGVGDPTAPAELTWTLIMAASRRLTQYVQQSKAGRWQIASNNPIHNQLGRRLKGATLGIWGYGKIGRLVAGYGRAFGMHVVVWGREPSRFQALSDGYQAATSKEELFAVSDVLTLHLRLNDATRGIVRLQDLSTMKPTALFVNTSRAELLESGSLDNAIQMGRPGQFALDVFEEEPPPIHSALLNAEQVLATPHLGYVEKFGYEMYFEAAFRNLLSFAKGEPQNVLNPEAWSSAQRLSP